ncbi:DUF2182 domain-containing protein [Euhalothece natronophila Z-M001]|uniref:DUF2182 domain-containing protein n=1 Tax=Euhalothece natronophila Z-M001 TaxID=522448 RepID=A0A5B8NMB4_9CHRO|nr:DUF2182 domain-containing protein [Euhalothece natronophila]QDZ40432.1 DUF2182 domain-containing protein [Euhalothece natronophila Z-M001]
MLSKVSLVTIWKLRDRALLGFKTNSTETILISLISIITILAWGLLWFSSISPYSRYLHDASGLGLITHSVILDITLSATFYTTVWLLMCLAMMLPTTLPLLIAWQRLISNHSSRWLLQGLVVAGYLSVWTVFGFLLYIADKMLHGVVLATPWLNQNYWVLGAFTLGLVGVFQFTPIKDYCLQKCRSPLNLVLKAWQQGNLLYQAWWLGVSHGIFCVGCCWALMLLMFVMGMGNFGWMLLLTGAMVIEKNFSWGQRLRAPLGVTFLIGTLIVLVVNIPVTKALF